MTNRGHTIAPHAKALIRFAHLCFSYILKLFNRMKEDLKYYNLCIYFMKLLCGKITTCHWVISQVQLNDPPMNVELYTLTAIGVSVERLTNRHDCCIHRISLVSSFPTARNTKEVQPVSPRNLPFHPKSNHHGKYHDGYMPLQCPNRTPWVLKFESGWLAKGIPRFSPDG